MVRQSEAAAELRKTLEVPIYNKTLRRDVGRGELDYEVYLHTRELLALQTPRDALVVPDELVFQVLHQTQELWLKCVAFEVANHVQQDLHRAQIRAGRAFDELLYDRLAHRDLPAPAILGDNNSEALQKCAHLVLASAKRQLCTPGGIPTLWVIDEAAASNRAVVLSVFKSNPAVRFYERLGFSEISADGAHVQMRWQQTT